MSYNYLKNMVEDVKQAIEENYVGAIEDLKNEDLTIEDFEEQLNEDLWVDDSVTGNASGSYYCNSYKAKESVLDNFELLKEMSEEFGQVEETGKKIMDEEWEWLDVSIRCYLLGQAISQALEEMEV